VNHVSIPSEGSIFSSSLKSPGLSAAHQTSYSMGNSGSSLEFSSWCMKLNSYIYPVVRLRMDGTIPSHPHMPSWCVQKKLNFLLTVIKSVNQVKYHL